MFIDRLRESSNLCIHPNDAYHLIPVDNGDMWYQCRVCQHSISIRDFLCRIVNPLWSTTLAREFASETGIIDVPCRFAVDQFKNRLLPETVVTRLSTVLKGLELLKAIHAPFLNATTTTNTNTVNPKLFKRLMTEYMALIDRVSLECDDNQRDSQTAETVKLILTNMKDVFSNVDMFDQYFNVLVPYVKRAAENIRPSSSLLQQQQQQQHSELETLGDALQRELGVSAALRDSLSPYCVPFDVVHAMVLCYLCADHVGLTYNIVLDFAAKLCCGFFSFPISRAFRTGIEIQNYIDVHIVPSKNYNLFSHLQKYRGSLADYFEEKFLKRYGELESKIRKHVPLADSSDRIERFIYQQTFPYMLFERNGDDSDYYAFVMALAHFASKSTLSSSSSSSKTATIGHVPGTSVPKGVEGECKRVYRFVKKCIMRVREFSSSSSSGNDTVYWTKDIFELFIASDKNFEKELIDIISVLVPSSLKYNQTG